MNIVKGFLFYSSVLVIMLFLCGGCETFVWYIPTIISSAIIYAMTKQCSEQEFSEFTGLNWFKKKTGIDLIEE